MNNRKEIREMVLFSIFLSILLMLGLVPFMGFIPIGPLAITTLHIPVILGITILKPRYSLMLGLMFGIVSMSVAYMRPRGPFDYIFQNPLVSVLPRALFGIVAWLMFHGFKKIDKSVIGKVIIVLSVVTITTVITLTGLIPFFRNNEINNPVLMAILTAGIILVIILTTLIISFLKQKEYLSLSATLILGTIIHTTLVFIAIIIHEHYFGTLAALVPTDIVSFLYVLFAANGLLEAIASVIIGIPVFIAIENILNSTK